MIVGTCSTHCIDREWIQNTGCKFSRFIHSFISLFSIYPYTGKTKDVELIIIDVKVYVKMIDVK